MKAFNFLRVPFKFSQRAIFGTRTIGSPPCYRLYRSEEKNTIVLELGRAKNPIAAPPPQLQK
jgi:hypothetical protein